MLELGAAHPGWYLPYMYHFEQSSNFAPYKEAMDVGQTRKICTQRGITIHQLTWLGQVTSPMDPAQHIPSQGFIKAVQYCCFEQG